MTQLEYDEAYPGKCPDEKNHTIFPDEPTGYSARVEWARKITLSHTQSKCKSCDRWVIWTEK